MFTAVADMIESHHERHGGHGYPHEQFGGDIPVFARIAAIVDCYDAITSQRPYARSCGRAMPIKRNVLLARRRFPGGTGRGTHSGRWRVSAAH